MDLFPKVTPDIDANEGKVALLKAFKKQLQVGWCRDIHSLQITHPKSQHCSSYNCVA